MKEGYTVLEAIEILLEKLSDSPFLAPALCGVFYAMEKTQLEKQCRELIEIIEEERQSYIEEQECYNLDYAFGMDKCIELIKERLKCKE